MEKLKGSLQDKLPGTAIERVKAVVGGHHKAIKELDSDINKAKDLITDIADVTRDRLSKLELRIKAIENTWYRRFGRWIKGLGKF